MKSTYARGSLIRMFSVLVTSLKVSRKLKTFDNPFQAKPRQKQKEPAVCWFFLLLWTRQESKLTASVPVADIFVRLSDSKNSLATASIPPTPCHKTKAPDKIWCFCFMVDPTGIEPATS